MHQRIFYVSLLAVDTCRASLGTSDRSMLEGVDIPWDLFHDHVTGCIWCVFDCCILFIMLEGVDVPRGLFHDVMGCIFDCCRHRTDDDL